MSDLRLSVAAMRDLQHIQDDGVQKFGTIAALRHMAAFERLFGLLREQPFAGPARPDYGSAIRILVNPPHRILYEIQADVVLIVRILHTARDVHRAMRSR